MANWLALAPPGGPKTVEEARQAAAKLAELVPEDREAISASKARLVEAERADRERLAELMRRGEDPTSDVDAITAAREQVGAAERRYAARELALAGANEELRTVIEQARGEWQRTAQRDLAKSHTRALRALDALDAALDELGQRRGVVWWLQYGVDRAQAAPSVGLLGDAKSSAHAMANSSPASRQSLMAWCRELVGDPPTAPQDRQATVEQVA